MYLPLYNCTLSTSTQQNLPNFPTAVRAVSQRKYFIHKSMKTDPPSQQKKKRRQCIKLLIYTLTGYAVQQANWLSKALWLRALVSGSISSILIEKVCTAELIMKRLLLGTWCWEALPKGCLLFLFVPLSSDEHNSQDQSKTDPWNDYFMNSFSHVCKASFRRSWPHNITQQFGFSSSPTTGEWLGATNLRNWPSLAE